MDKLRKLWLMVIDEKYIYYILRHFIQYLMRYFSPPTPAEPLDATEAKQVQREKGG